MRVFVLLGPWGGYRLKLRGLHGRKIVRNYRCGPLCCWGLWGGYRLKLWGIALKENGVELLYEDADILVCIKPAGVASQTRKTGQQDMVSILRNARHEKGEEPYIGLVHRLDQPVEGILVFGKHAKSTAALSRQLSQGSFSKIYLAVALGDMPLREGRLQDYLKKDGRSNLSSIARKGDPLAKKAELLYQVLETDASQSPAQNLVRIQLLTGRHHQIRVQMAHLGTPLAGDAKYGVNMAYLGAPLAGDAKYGANMAHLGAPLAGDAKYGAKTGTQRDGTSYGLGLCACELEFVHPVRKKIMKFEITPSQGVFQKFGSFPKK